MSASPNKSPAAGSVRDARGRFLPGHPPTSPGRLPRHKEERYLTALTGEVSTEDWLEIIRTAKTQAKHGNKDARKWLSDLLVGRDPVQFFNMLFLGQEQRPSIEDIRQNLDALKGMRGELLDEIQARDARFTAQ